MSFRCQITNKISRQGDPRVGELYYVGENKIEEGIRAPEKLNRIVVQTRERTYTRWVKNEETNKYEEVECGQGWEVVKEIQASAEGLALWQSWNDDERANFLKYM